MIWNIYHARFMKPIFGFQGVCLLCIYMVWNLFQTEYLSVQLNSQNTLTSVKSIPTIDFWTFNFIFKKILLNIIYRLKGFYNLPPSLVGIKPIKIRKPAEIPCIYGTK